MTGIDFYLQVSWREKEVKASESTLTSVGEEGGSISGIFVVFSQQKFQVVTFWVHWWHRCPYFSCPFRSGLLERGCSLSSPFMLLRCWCHTFCSLFICERMAGMWIKSRANFLSTLTGLGNSSFSSHYKWDSASFSAFPASHNHFEFDTLFMGDVFLL